MTQQICVYCQGTFPRPDDTPPWEPARACHRVLCQERDREYRAEVVRGAAAVEEREVRKVRRVHGAEVIVAPRFL